MEEPGGALASGVTYSPLPAQRHPPAWKVLGLLFVLMNVSRGVCTDSCFMFLLDKDWEFSTSAVFSGLKIDPDTLVKKLDLDSRSVISSRTGLLLYCE